MVSPEKHVLSCHRIDLRRGSGNPQADLEVVGKLLIWVLFSSSRN